MSASSPRSATAASTSSSATRRTPSGPGSRGRSASSARRSARSSRAEGRILDLVVRLEHPPDAAGDRRRARGRPLGQRDRPLDAQEPRTSRATSATSRRPTTCSSGRRPRRAAARAAADPLHRLQGEPLSALTRIAYNDHPAVHVERGDTVIISARAVPGNELRVHDSINRLTGAGQRFCTRRTPPSTSPATAARRSCGRSSACCAQGGDAGARRIPHARRACRLAHDSGRARGRVDHPRRERLGGRALASTARAIVDQVQAGMTFVDGLGVGDVHDVALRDRRRLPRTGS